MKVTVYDHTLNHFYDVEGVAAVGIGHQQKDLVLVPEDQGKSGVPTIIPPDKWSKLEIVK